MGIDLAAVFIEKDHIRAGSHLHGPVEFPVGVEAEAEVVPAAGADQGPGPGKRAAVVDADGDETEGLPGVPFLEHLRDGIHLFQAVLAGDKPERHHIGRPAVHPVSRGGCVPGKRLEFHLVPILRPQRQERERQKQKADEEALVKIIKEPKNSMVKQYSALFKLDDVNLFFDEFMITL